MGLYGVSNMNQLSSLFGTNFSNPLSSLPSSITSKLSENSKLGDWYGLNTSKPTESSYSALGVKSAAAMFKQSIDKVASGLSATSNNNNTLFNQSKVTSANADVASASLHGSTGLSKSQTKDINLSVSQTAAKQSSSTNNMKADESSFAAGAQTFTINTLSGANGSTAVKGKDLTVQVKEGDTNLDVLNKMAGEINNSGTGLKANVVTNKDTGAVSLQVEGKDTGAKNAFTIEDKSGSLISGSGMREDVKAADAVYKVDGTQYTSASNNINIGNVSAELKSAGDTKLSFSQSTDGLRSAVNSFVESYNNMYSSSPKAASQMLNVSSTYKSALTKAGFSFDNDGKLSISDSSFDKGVESGAMKSLFSGGNNYGFASRLSQIARTAGSSPQAYSGASGAFGMYNSASQQNYMSQMLGLFYNSSF